MTRGRVDGYRPPRRRASVTGMTTTDRPGHDGLGARLQSQGRGIGPGLAAVVIGTAVAVAVNALVPAVSALTVAVVLGVLAGGVLPPATAAGLRWATRKFLRVGVVLLGLQLGLGQVAGLGA